jgi:hypothetical protein
MLHVRVVSPPGVTARLLDRLADLPGVSNLVVLQGVARRPDGDAVAGPILMRRRDPL